VSSQAGVEPNHWLWVTGPEYYLDEDGRDRADLEPTSSYTPRHWWTCDRRTREGDQILLYRADQKKDIAYLIVARSDAYSLESEIGVVDGWKWGCDFEVVERFNPGLTIAEMRQDPMLVDWPALKRNFVGRSHRIDDMYWSHLKATLGLSEERLDARLAQTEYRYKTEKEIQQRLFANPDLFRSHGLRLDMKDCEVRLPGGGIIDILAWDRGGQRYVIIELKRAAADFKALGQVVAYRDTWQSRRPWIRRPLGLLVGDSLSPKIRDVVKRRRRVRFIALKDLGIVIDVP
jgi:hypothetical protein